MEHCKLFLAPSAYKQGFTLIELSIVLVIVALVMGGITVGKSLIEVAGLRKLMSEWEQVELATQTFKQKYNCILGDCNKATRFALGTNGNGNNTLSG